MKFEYKLIKWIGEEFEEIQIKIQEEAIEDFCGMMDWDEEEFEQNTIRYPIKVIKVEESEPEEADDVADDIVDEKKPKRKRRTKAEMEEAGKVIPKKKIGGKRKYPSKMEEFIEKHMENKSNLELCKLIEQEFDIEITCPRLASFMAYNNIRRGHPKTLDPKIITFIKKQNTTDAYAVRDLVIEKFEVNLTPGEIKKYLTKLQEIPGEGVDDEVKRIKEQRVEFDEDDDFEDLRLDD